MKPGKILVVDDTPIALKLLSNLLIAEGYTVRSAINGELALKSATKDTPDLILLDIRMPDMDGFEVCRRLKADPVTHDVPVIFVSAAIEVDDILQGFAVGASDYVTKPFQREEVMARIQTHLELRYAKDVLEQRVRERTAELEESLHKLRETELAMDLAGIGIHLVDGTTGQLLYVNDYFCQRHGYTRKEMLGMTMFEIDPSLPQLPFSEIAIPFRNKGHDRFEAIHKHKDGHEFPVEIVIYYHAPKKEGSNGHYIAFMSDISERKKAEEDLLRSEARYRTLYNSTSDAVMLLNEKGFFDCNCATIELFGCASVEEFCTKHPADLSPPVQPDGTDSMVLANLHINTAMKLGSLRFEWLHQRADTKETFPAEVLLSALELDGKPILQATVRDISERKKAEDVIEHLAFYDPLTDLPNRRLLIDRLNHALINNSRRGHHGALMFIDLDNFKNLNDTMGHDIGDLLLKQVAEQLTSCVRQGDTVSRLGGDEFVVMLEDLSNEIDEAATHTESVGLKILSVLSKTYRYPSYIYQGSASIGVTIFSDNDYFSADDLMKQIDIAMYQAKSAGRNTLRFFDTQMQTHIDERAALENDLHHAIQNKELQLYYQIQVDSTRRPIGAEALVRWNHPHHGVVSPVHFIALAEETGLILSIGEWVLETACAQLKRWQQDERTRDLSLAVNVSARQFLMEDFGTQVKAVVQRYGIDPKLLKLELTEGILLENMDATISILNSLNKLGIQFSLDDFGTGYSSLQYLKRLPLNQLKIDQSFVRHIVEDSNDRAIVSAIIAIAHSLNLNVIAEGVETEGQRQMLLDYNCSLHQGYLYGKPMQTAQFEQLLNLD